MYGQKNKHMSPTNLTFSGPNTNCSRNVSRIHCGHR